MRTCSPAAGRRRAWLLIAALVVLPSAGLIVAALVAGRPGSVRAEAHVPPRLDDLPPLEPRAAAAIGRRIDDVEHAPQSAAAWLELAMTLHAWLQHEPALHCYRTATRLGPDDARAWYLRSIVEERIGQTDDALASLRRSIECDGRFAGTHRRLGLWLLRAGDGAAAEAALQRALQLEPDDRHALLLLARAHLQQSQPAAARSILEPLVAHAPRDPYARFLFGTALRALGEHERAERELALGGPAEPQLSDPWIEQVRRLYDGDQARRVEALAALRDGRAADGVRLLEALRRDDPEDVEVIIELSRARRMLGEVEAALELLAEVERRAPDHRAIHFHLAAALRQKAADGAGAGEPLLLRALDHADRCIELAPGSPEGHAIRADVLRALGRTGEAAESIARAAQLDPANSAWALQLGADLCALERWEQALPALRTARELQPQAPAAWYLLAAALANSGRLEEAHQLLTSPEAPRDDQRLALALGRVEQALRAAAATGTAGQGEDR